MSSGDSSLAAVPSSEILANVTPMLVQLLNNFLAFTCSLTAIAILSHSGARSSLIHILNPVFLKLALAR